MLNYLSNTPLGYRLHEVRELGTGLMTYFTATMLQQILQQQGRFSESEKFKRQAEESLEIFGSDVIIIKDPADLWFLSKYGLGAFDENKKLKPLYLPEKILRARQGEDQLAIASTLHDLGTYYSSIREFSKAKQYLGEALELVTQLGDKSAEIVTLVSLADLSFDQQAYSLAESYAKKSLKRAKEAGTNDPMNPARLTLAQSLVMQKKNSQSLEILRKLEPDLQKANDTNGLIGCYEAFYVVLLQLGKKNEALAYHQKADQLRKHRQ